MAEQKREAGRSPRACEGSPGYSHKATHGPRGATFRDAGFPAPYGFAAGQNVGKHLATTRGSPYSPPDDEADMIREIRLIKVWR